MDYRDNPQHRVPHHIKWTSFAPPWWTNFAPPLTRLVRRLVDPAGDVVLGAISNAWRDPRSCSDVGYLHTEGQECLTQIIEHRLHAKWVGEGQNRREWHSVFGHFLIGTSQILYEQPPVRRLANAPWHCLRKDFHWAPFQPVLNQFGFDDRALAFTRKVQWIQAPLPTTIGLLLLKRCFNVDSHKFGPASGAYARYAFPSWLDETAQVRPTGS